MSTPPHVGAAHPVTSDCRFCWMCRHVCPVGHVTQRETYTPHAWALLIAAVGNGAAAWTPEAVDVLYTCADCGMCQTHCVTDRALPDAIVSARTALVMAGDAPAAVYALRERLTQWQTPYAAQAPQPSRTRGDVALFVGDAAHYLSPRTAEAALELLEMAGVRAVPVGVGRSTGLLASAIGAEDTAVELGRAVLDEIDRVGCRDVLVLGAEDRFAFMRVYPERLGLRWPAEVNVRDVATVLHAAANAGTLAFTAPAHVPPFAYLDPPHAPRIGCDGIEARQLLRRVLGSAASRDLFWRGERGHPAGSVGGLEWVQPAVADRLSDARLADASAAGVSWLISDHPASAHHLARRAPATIEIIDFYDLLARQMTTRQ